MHEVRELAGPGELETVAAIPTSADADRILDTLGRPFQSGPEAFKISCWPPPPGDRTYLFVFDSGRIAYVRNDRVELFDGAYRDAHGQLARIAETALTTARVTTHASICDECSHKDLGKVWNCPCGGEGNPALLPWRYERVIVSNNCYSYAWDKRMCDNQQGAIPGRRVVSSLERLLDGIAQDGLILTSEKNLLKPGRYVGLLASNNGGCHFLRLDGEFWTHKVGSFPVSMCDRNEQRIPTMKLRDAAFDPFFDHRLFFTIPPGLTLPHCFR